jgi:hypothetical protein
VQIAKLMAKLDPARDVELVVYPLKRTIFDWLENPFGTSTTTALDGLLRRPDARVMASALSMFQLYRRGELLTLMPNVFWN